MSFPIPKAEVYRLHENTCQERKDILVDFMIFQTGHHELRSEVTGEICQYDKNTNWCDNFCGYHHIIEHKPHFELTNLNVNAFRNDDACCPKFLVQLFANSHIEENKNIEIDSNSKEVSLEEDTIVN